MPQYLLSIDFDFFVRTKKEWDWAHAEARMYREVLWTSRAPGLLLMEGVDDPREATTPPEGHVDILGPLSAAGIDLEGALFTVSDSHALALRAFAPHLGEDGEDFNVLHFDAHHDLGYNARDVRDHGKRGVVTCDDWLYWTMVGAPGLHAEVIYPAWRGEEEWEHFRDRKDENRGPPWYDKLNLGLRTGVSVFPDLPEDLESGPVAAIHLCRSGSWSPPWHDPEFIALARKIEKATGTPALVPWADAEGCDVFTPRPYSLAETRARAKLYRSANTRK